MIIDTSRLITIFIEAGSFIAAFAAITAGFVMAQITKKFGSGILASGFKTNSSGIFFIAIAILIDSVNEYLIINNYLSFLPAYTSLALILTKEVFFVIGTYIIVIGSKKTGDKIEKLMK